MIWQTDFFPWEYPPHIDNAVCEEWRIIEAVQKLSLSCMFNHVDKFIPSLLQFYAKDGDIPPLALAITRVWANGLADLEINDIRFDQSYFAQARRRGAWYRRNWVAFWGDIDDQWDGQGGLNLSEE